MRKRDLLAALHVLPRYDGSSRQAKWHKAGRLTIINANVLPGAVERPLTKTIAKMDDAINAGEWPTSRVGWVDIGGPNVWVLHRTLTVSHLMWLAKQGWAWQRWRRHKLPIYVQYAGRLIIWNGTHRMCLGRLAGRKIRARIIDLDAYVKWSKRNAKTKRVPKPRKPRRSR